LVTEYEIRRELSAIDAARLSGFTRARRMLRIAKRVHGGALTLAHLSLRALQEGDNDAAARFRIAARRLVELHDEIRTDARQALCGSGGRQLSEVGA